MTRPFTFLLMCWPQQRVALLPLLGLCGWRDLQSVRSGKGEMWCLCPYRELRRGNSQTSAGSLEQATPMPSHTCPFPHPSLPTPPMPLFQFHLQTTCLHLPRSPQWLPEPARSFWLISCHKERSVWVSHAPFFEPGNH
jgi:hypothetical protein